MTSKQRKFLNLRTLPGQVTSQEMAWLLGFSSRDIPALVKGGLLKPLPGVDGRRRRFAVGVAKQLKLDQHWLDKATNVAETARRARYRRRQSGSTK